MMVEEEEETDPLLNTTKELKARKSTITKRAVEIRAPTSSSSPSEPSYRTVPGC